MQMSDHLPSAYRQWVRFDCLSMLTLSRIGINESLIRPNDMMVRAFDGTKTLTCGESDLKVLVGMHGLRSPS